jgi:hypothetical protein
MDNIQIMKNEKDNEVEYRTFTEEELKWIKRFRRVMNQAPDTLLLFCGSGTMIVYTKDENNERYMTDFRAVDDDAPCMEITTNMEADGGDW